MNVVSLSRICLIEDDQIMVEALQDRFVLEGFACDCYTTGRAAQQALARKHYDVVICDIQLPDINGEDLFVELLERLQLPSGEPALPPSLGPDIQGRSSPAR